MLKRYPLDPTGVSTDNLVKGEVHTLDDQVDLSQHRILFTRNGSYYNDSLVVMQEGRRLVLNKDYQFAFFWQDATTKLGNPVSVAFQIINPDLIGDIQVTYQAVGGEYQERYNGLIELIKVLPINVRNVFWDEVLAKPEAFVPTRHLHHINDVFGCGPLVRVIDDLRRALEKQSVLKLKLVYDRFLKLKQYVEANLGQTDVVKIELEKALAKINGATNRFITADEAGDVLDQKLATALATINTELQNIKNLFNSGTLTLFDNKLQKPSNRNQIVANNASVTFIPDMTDISNNTTSKNTDRRIFAPRTKIRFEKSTSWTVPASLDGLIAQVVCKTYTNNNTEMDYIVLKAGEVVNIEIKELMTPQSPLSGPIADYNMVNRYHRVSFGHYCSLISEVDETKPEVVVESRKGDEHEPQQQVYHLNLANKKNRLERVAQIRPNVNLMTIGSVTLFV